MRKMTWLIVPAVLVLVAGATWADEDGQRPPIASPTAGETQLLDDSGGGVSASVGRGVQGSTDHVVAQHKPHPMPPPPTIGDSVSPSHFGESSGKPGIVRSRNNDDGNGPRGPSDIKNLDTAETFATIQDAIDDADTLNGHTLEVQVSSHAEGIVTVTKSLTLQGQNGTETVTASTDTGGSGDARGWFVVNSGVVLDVVGLTFDGDSGSGRKVHQAFRIKGSGSFTDCAFQDIKFAQYLGFAVVPFGDGPVDFTDCTFSNIERVGVLYYGAGVTGSIYDGNVYTGKGPIDCLDYGVELGGGAVATITNSTVTDCEGVASSDGSTSAGVLITTYYGSGTAGDLFGNVITDNTCGIAVGYDAADTSTVVANYNDVSGNTAEGIDNTSSTETVDAEKNWWGTTDLTVIAGMVSGNVDYDPPLLTDRIRMAFGGNRLVDLQNNDGGWDWPLDDGNPNNASPQNTIGPIGMGLAKSYRATSDPPGMVDALQNVSAFLLAKTNTFSPSDGYLAAELDSILGGTTHVDHLNTYFYGPLAAGTYDRNGAGTVYSTASYIQLIHDARHGGGIGNLAAWDIGMGLVGAASCGVSGSELDLWIQGVEDEIDLLDGDEYYDVIGLAGAVYGLAFVGEDFDPTAGEHAAAGSLGDLADILAGYQLNTGGFTWNSGYMGEGEDNETIQETGYATLALEEMGGYTPEIASAAQYMLSVQLPTGGWKNSAGGGENNEVTAEALWGLWAASHAELTLEPDADCYADTDTVTVELWMHDVGQIVVGGQFFLEYDDSVLSFVSAVAESPFLELDEDSATAGLIDYSVYIPPPGSAVTGDAHMATITFTASGNMCTEPDLITFRPHDPPTRLSDEYGGPVYPLSVDMSAITIDSTLPVITCPDPVSVQCPGTEPAAATNLTEFLALSGADVSDNCTPQADIVITHVSDVSDGNTCPETITRTYRATDCAGNSADCTQAITVDDTIAPVITGCPSNINVNADAGGCTAVVTWTPPTADDNCGLYSFTSTHNSGDTFGPGGPTTVIYTAEDDCGNIETCSFDVTVSGDNELVVDVELSPTIVGSPLTRCITFELWSGGTWQATVEEELTFLSGSATAALVLVPCGSYDCITATDTLHTLRRTDSALAIIGTQYDAVFTGGDKLVGGNLNDDQWIDILDFGVFSWKWATHYDSDGDSNDDGHTPCGMFTVHADINGNGSVGTEDFTFIQVNFLMSRELDCDGSPGPEFGPRTRISVAELHKLGMSELAAGDLNHDGWLDEADIEAFLQGVRPKTPGQGPDGGPSEVTPRSVRPRR